jgi:hypothetical protein
MLGEPLAEMVQDCTNPHDLNRVIPAEGSTPR